MLKRPLIAWLFVAGMLLVFIFAGFSSQSRFYFFGGYETAVGMGAAFAGLVVLASAREGVLAVSAGIASWLREKISLPVRLLLITLACVPGWIVGVSYLAGKNWLGDYARPLRADYLLLMILLFAFLGPTAAEQAEMRRKRWRDYLHWRREHRDGL